MKLIKRIKSIRFKRIFNVLFSLGLLVLTISLLSTTSSNNLHNQIASSTIQIDYHSGVSFVQVASIETILATYQSKINQAPQPELQFSLQDLEQALYSNPYVAKANVFIDANQQLVVSIRQKQPIARVIHNSSVDYYLTKTGEIMPVSPNFTSYVPVITGSLPTYRALKTTNDQPIIEQVLQLIHSMKQHAILTKTIDHIHIDKNQQVQLVSKIGNHTIQIGGIESTIDTRLQHLELFYQQAIKQVDIKQYKNINLTYNNQIVCTKK